MCQEVFEIVQKMDLSKVETRLALQCAPVILGIKLSNLLTVSSEDEEVVSEILRETGIQYYCLHRQKNKTIYFLFRTKELEVYLQELDVKSILVQFGYGELSTLGVIEEFQKRYEAYMQHGKEFPHEIGVLLGYPLEDVKGFINNKGEKYLYAGYWKVYKEVEEKKLLFDAYECAKEGLLLLVAHGYDLRQIIVYFQEERY